MIIILYTHLEIPSMVLDTVAIELFGATRSGSCVIFTQWERPKNEDDSYISFYIIDDRLSNTSYIANERSDVIYLPMCEAQSISIRAFDRCNRGGATAEVPIRFGSVRNDEITTIVTESDVTDAPSVNSIIGNPTSARNDQSVGMSNGAIYNS
jgi:hypothetical protein